MYNELLILFTAIFSLGLGFLLGKYIANLQYKTKNNALAEKTNRLQFQLDEHKKTAQNNITQIAKQLTDIQNDTDKKISSLTREREEIRREKDFLNTTLTRRNTEYENLKHQLNQQKSESEALQVKFTKEFENLANKILEEKSSKFTSQNQENLKNILTPLQERINLFEKKIEDSHKQSIDYHAALRQQIIGLKDLNEQMSREAINLTKALKGDTKTQGNWGELVLERVLEKSGLEKNREYFVQQSFTTIEGNRVLPDVIIHLPDDKKMVIDSKVTLVAYERYINEEDETKKAIHLKEHLLALKRHVDQLSSKNYQDLYAVDSPDFVLLFVPIEPAFAIALNEDTNLYNQAFEKNIVIVTPTTLLATLRTIDTMWNNEKQQRHAIDIARQAGALYDKFEGFVKDLHGIGKRLNDTQKEYDAAMNKLIDGRGNLISRVEKLKKMGADAKKALPEELIHRADTNDH
ncbi:DNA recombination protein RmuC [Aquimarina rhabdastrellae]